MRYPRMPAKVPENPSEYPRGDSESTSMEIPVVSSTECKYPLRYNKSSSELSMRCESSMDSKSCDSNVQSFAVPRLI